MFKSFTTSQTKPTSYREEIVSRNRLYRPPVTDGLKLWLDPRSYRGSGDWYDRSRVGGAAVLNNGVVHNGDYFTFDGVDDFMRVTRSDFTQAGFNYQEITVNMFFRNTGGGAVTGNIITLENSFELASISNGRIDYASNPWAWRYSTDTYPVNNWYMITYVHTLNNRQMYVNGELAYDNASTSNSADSGYLIAPRSGEDFLTIGSRRLGATSNFGGDIGSVYIHDRALSQREIQYMFDLDRGRYGI